MAVSYDRPSEANRIDELMRRLATGEQPRYDLGVEIWESAMAWMSKHSPDIAHPLWLIWGALTDWVETRPEETEIAESEMVRAAKEWLELNWGDAARRKEYFDRWVYEELGYQRPPAEETTKPEQAGDGDA